jgi:hypothetical protein
LIESKNKAIIRKWMGYSHIKQKHEKRINHFVFGSFHEYLNYHRVCAFPSITVDKKGEEKKQYKQEDYMTPFEKLKSLSKEAQNLKPGTTIEMLEKIARRHTDNEMAQIVDEERRKMFDEIKD